MSQIVPHLNLFRPGEAEAITGLSPAMQRDYRFRGFLRKFEGHARFNVFDLAEMYMLKRLSDSGFWPDVFAPVAKIAAHGLAFFLLESAGSYEGRDADIERFCAIHNCPAVKVFETIGLEISASKYLIMWASRDSAIADHEFTDDIGASFSEDIKGGRAFLQQDGPVTVYNLKYMCMHLLSHRLLNKAYISLSSGVSDR